MYFVLASSLVHCDIVHLSPNQMNCSDAFVSACANGSLCPKPFNLNESNPSLGLCACPASHPIRLSSDIPCLRAKLLGEVCLHSRECTAVQNAACFATILFPFELLSIPTYRQWYIYNQITESNELNYLLNKVYGECRCKAGYRGTRPDKCVSKSRDTWRSCLNETECTLPHSICNIHQGRCLCSVDFFYDRKLDLCTEILSQYQQFCVISSDCQVRDPNLQCIKSRCACAVGYRFTNATNQCLPTKECEYGQVWSNSSASCEPPS